MTYYPKLETLRGLAALMVAVGHSFIALTFSGIDKLWLRPVWSIPFESLDAFLAVTIIAFANGSAAVTIFFVLSGVVLGLSIDASARNIGFYNGYLAFLVKRIFRIYPAHAVSILSVGAVLILLGIANPGTFEKSTTWYNWYYRNTPNAEAIFSNLLLVKVFLNPVIWTLKVEVIVALFFPLLHLMSRIRWRYAPLLQVALLSLLIWVAIENPTGVVLPHVYKFYLGLLIPIYGRQFVSSEKQTGTSSMASIIILLSIVAILVEKQLAGGGSYRGYGIVQSFGATLLILMLMRSSGGWLVRSNVLRRLGQFSYSFYLWHFPILWLMYYALHKSSFTQTLIQNYAFGTASIVCIASVSVAYLVASASYWGVEHKMIILGRRLVAKLWKSEVPPKAALPVGTN